MTLPFPVCFRLRFGGRRPFSPVNANIIIEYPPHPPSQSVIAGI